MEGGGREGERKEGRIHNSERKKEFGKKELEGTKTPQQVSMGRSSTGD
jgi:hypothetical protein